MGQRRALWTARARLSPRHRSSTLWLGPACPTQAQRCAATASTTSARPGACARTRCAMRCTTSTAMGSAGASARTTPSKRCWARTPWPAQRCRRPGSTGWRAPPWTTRRVHRAHPRFTVWTRPSRCARGCVSRCMILRVMVPAGASAATPRSKICATRGQALMPAPSYLRGQSNRHREFLPLPRIQVLSSWVARLLPTTSRQSAALRRITTWRRPS